jgi:hypothetical protein
MVLEVARSSIEMPPHPRSKPVVTWEPLPASYRLPDDPVENIQQPLLAAALTDALGAARLIQPEMLVASNFGLVAKIDQKTIVKAPDWLLVPQVPPLSDGGIRRSYTPHAEGGPVAIVMEFLSDEDGHELSLRASYPYGKLYFYEQILQVPTYVTFDPYAVALEVRQLQADGHYRQVASEHDRFWIPELELFLGVWRGERLHEVADWLRWWDRDGVMLPWAAEQADQERERAEQEQERAEQERERAEQEQERAEQERERAEQERERADREQEKAAILAAKLRSLGVDPETL